MPAFVRDHLRVTSFSRFTRWDQFKSVQAETLENSQRIEKEHPDRDVATGDPKLLDLPAKASYHTRHAKHQEEIGEHASEHGELDDPVEAAPQSRRRDEELWGVPKGCVQEGPNGPIGMLGNLFCHK